VHAQNTELQDRAAPLASAASLQLSASAASDTHTTEQRPAAAGASGGETGRGVGGFEAQNRPVVILTILCFLCARLRACVCKRGYRTALATNKRRAAVSVVAAGATVALFALAAIAISDSNARTELIYRSSLSPLSNPAWGTGKVRVRETPDCAVDSQPKLRDMDWPQVCVFAAHRPTARSACALM
jgi:hypothetical protein